MIASLTSSIQSKILNFLRFRLIFFGLIYVYLQKRLFDYFCSWLGLILQGNLLMAVDFVSRHKDCFFDIVLLSTSSLIKKAEDTDTDSAELSAIKLRSQQQSSNALVVTDQRPANGYPQGSQLGMVMIPSTSDVDHNVVDQGLNLSNGTLSVVDSQPPDAHILGDLLTPLAIEGPPGVSPQSEHNNVREHESAVSVDNALALTPVEDQESTVKYF